MSQIKLLSVFILNDFIPSGNYALRIGPYFPPDGTPKFLEFQVDDLLTIGTIQQCHDLEADVIDVFAQYLVDNGFAEDVI